MTHNTNTDRSDDAAKPSDTPAGRALAEAEERRRQADSTPHPAKEIGREGLDPARYGDWEKKGIASDF